MDQRNFIIRTVVVLVLAFLWLQIAQRWLLPQFFPNAQNRPPAAAQPEDGADGEEKVAAPGELVEARTDRDDAEPAPSDEPEELIEHPRQTVKLGSLEPDSGYFALVTIDSAGAAIASVELNDRRYTRIGNRNAPLRIVGNDPDADLKTLQTSIQLIDEQLKKFGTSLAEVNWEIVPGSLTESEVAFRYRAPDGTLEVRKHYRLHAGNPEARDSDALGYVVDFKLEIQNLGNQSRDVVYTLLGPVGLPLEDEDNTRTYIELKAGTIEDPRYPDSVSDVSQTAAKIVDQMEKAAVDPAAVETWKSPLKYVGADVQYFAALIVPQENQVKSRYFSEARPVLVRKDPKNTSWSDVSVQLRSETVALAPAATLDHQFQVYFGPKRDDLLEPLGASGVLNFGWFAIISRGMLAVLNFFHHTLLAPYGIAIIMLTVVVRACMFPISRKMAQNQQRMKELQPKMQEIRNKYKDDQEKMAQAYREFMAKHGFNPLAGCLPMLLQLPIFFGLYQALYNSVDLRMARFLWIDNLAAPDQLFPFGFTIPLLGWTHFNLLPLITVALFVVQQKMFMPPPTTEEQAMQYKMMNFFTIFIGFMFYRVPAGLCVYFIASSLWGIAERKILEYTDGITTKPAAEDSDSTSPGRSGGDSPARESDDQPPKPPGLLQRLVEAADKAKSSTNGTGSSRVQKRPGPGTAKGSGKARTGRKSKGRR